MEIEIKHNPISWLSNPMQLLPSDEKARISGPVDLIFTPFESRSSVIIMSGNYRFPVPFWVLKKMQYFYENLILCGRQEYHSEQQIALNEYIQPAYFAIILRLIILYQGQIPNVPKVKDNIVENVMDRKMIILLTNLGNNEILKLYNSAHFLKAMNIRRNIAAWFACKVYVVDPKTVEQELLRAGLGCKQINEKISENESLKALLEERKKLRAQEIKEKKEKL